jgi:TPR repeat protein
VVGAGVADGCVGGAVSAVKLAPQNWQKAAFGGVSFLQFGHIMYSGFMFKYKSFMVLLAPIMPFICNHKHLQVAAPLFASLNSIARARKGVVFGNSRGKARMVKKVLTFYGCQAHLGGYPLASVISSSRSLSPHIRVTA